ncbi:DUF6701 domain-containing protein [Salinispirillum marinum]|uniref:DUF6701 domain-containing protein n=2 Tax=Saccharospirillaceae TaxID=255527 RepID=A0ABV8BB69_9GAMM
MTKFRRQLSAIVLLLLAISSSAATFTLPGAVGSGPFSACVSGLGGSVVNCAGNINLSGDNLAISQDVTLNISGSLSMNNNSEINAANIYTLTLVIAGNFTANNGLAINADATVNGFVDFNNNAEISGSITATGDITLKNNAIIEGSITTDSDIDIGNNTNITGELSAGGDINIGSGSVTGNCSGSGGNYPSICSSTLLAIDDFEAYGVGSISGSSGGIGWSGAWSGVAGRQQVISTAGSVMVYEDSAGDFVVGGERALQLNGSDNEAAARDTAVTFEGNTLYVSMLVRFNVNASINNQFAALWFDQPTFGNYPNIGLKSNQGNGGGANDLFARTRSNNEVYNTAITNGTTYFIVGRLRKTTTGSGQPFDEFALWVNPPTLATETAPNVVASGDSAIAAFDRIGFRTVNLGNSDTMTLDRLAIGLDWDDVVTIADPEDVPDTELLNIELVYNGSALTCQASNVTVRACADAACTELYTDPVTVNVTPAGWTGGTSIALTNGTATVGFQRTTEGEVNLGVSGVTPAITGFTAPRCVNSGSVDASCTIDFADTGFVFDVPDVLANRPATGITVAAVNTDDETQECVPAFANVTRTLNFWSDYVSPNATGRPVSWPVSVNSTDVGLTSGTATALPLSFNASGVAEISVQYADAGSMQLNARYTGSVANGDDGLVMLSSDPFVSRPVGITLEAANGCGAIEDVSCNNTVVAGADYTLTATARAWQVDGDTDLSDNPVTPNFQLSNIALSHQLVAPSGGQLGTLGRTTYNHVPAANGVTTIADQSVSEVGIFEFSAALPNYFGAAVEHATATTGNSARFIPASIDYDVQAVALAAHPYFIGARDFVYQGQNFGLNLPSTSAPGPAVIVTARNLSGQRTVNYFGSFFRSPNNVATTVEHDAVNMDTEQTRVLQSGGTVLGHMNTGFDAGKNYSGWLVFNFPYPQWRYERSGTPDELTANEAPQEIRGIWTIPQASLEDPEACTGSNCADSATLTQALSGPQLVYGRLRLRDVSGPVQVPLDMPVQYEVWDGTRFSLYAAETGGDQTPLHVSNFTRTIVPGVGNLLENDASLSWNSAVAGEGSIRLTVSAVAQAAGRNEGVYRATAQGIPAHLRFDWNADGTAEPPSATASFGFYTGRAPLLFRMPIGR